MPPVLPSRLPGFAGVVAELVLLNPDGRASKQVDAAQVIPMGMTDDHVGDFFGLNPREAHGLVGAQVVCDRPEFKPAVAMKSGVEQDIAAAASDQPDGVDVVDFFVFGGAHHHLRYRISGRIGEADGLDGILR